ncbi:MAG TPA: hypothetical protein VNB49_10465, partial [Candidatus Dormibacteraeota bacterium]|nr:hypothetical protein [Candidatus Dormibacteraeota bacterium]
RPIDAETWVAGVHEKERVLDAQVFPGHKLLHYNPRMARRRPFFSCLAACSLASSLTAQQTPPRPLSPAPSAAAPTGARILLLPRRIVSGERATLAVLDVNGRLTPGVAVGFSNGDHFKTDATGRALFVAPLNPGVLWGSIEGRPGRVSTVVLTPAETSLSSMEISSAPRVASLTDRFEILGKGFCGDADANQVTIASHSALVLASSPVALTVLPPMELDPGPEAVSVSCAKKDAPQFTTTFVELELKADSSPLKRGEHRMLAVRVRGTTEKISLEARNLAPEIAELVGGNPVRRLSSGSGENENVAQFEIVGKNNGSFLISIRLVSTMTRPE